MNKEMPPEYSKEAHEEAVGQHEKADTAWRVEAENRSKHMEPLENIWDKLGLSELAKLMKEETKARERMDTLMAAGKTEAEGLNQEYDRL